MNIYRNRSTGETRKADANPDWTRWKLAGFAPDDDGPSIAESVAGVVVAEIISEAFADTSSGSDFSGGGGDFGGGGSSGDW